MGQHNFKIPDFLNTPCYITLKGLCCLPLLYGRCNPCVQVSISPVHFGYIIISPILIRSISCHVCMCVVCVLFVCCLCVDGPPQPSIYAALPNL